MTKLRIPRRIAALVFAAACAVGLAACGSGGGSGSGTATSGTASVKSGGSITYALDEDLDGFNILYANDDEEVLNYVIDNVWPRAFTITPGLTPQLDTNYVTSATVTKTDPQTV